MYLRRNLGLYRFNGLLGIIVVTLGCSGESPANNCNDALGTAGSNPCAGAATQVTGAHGAVHAIVPYDGTRLPRHCNLPGAQPSRNCWHIQLRDLPLISGTATAGVWATVSAESRGHGAMRDYTSIRHYQMQNRA
jgi:hypothetical protein